MTDDPKKGMSSDDMDEQANEDAQSKGGQASGGSYTNDQQDSGTAAEQDKNARTLTDEE